MAVGKSFKGTLSGLEVGSKVMFIADQIDQTAISILLEDYHRIFETQELNFESHILDGDISGLIKSSDCALFLVSNRIWDTIPEKVKEMPNVIRPLIEFDRSSVEESKVSMGITG